MFSVIIIIVIQTHLVQLGVTGLVFTNFKKFLPLIWKAFCFYFSGLAFIIHSDTRWQQFKKKNMLGFEGRVVKHKFSAGLRYQEAWLLTRAGFNLNLVECRQVNLQRQIGPSDFESKSQPPSRTPLMDLTARADWSFQRIMENCHCSVKRDYPTPCC